MYVLGKVGRNNDSYHRYFLQYFKGISTDWWLYYSLLDFGVDTLEDLAAECNFPWLLSNVIDNLTQEPLAKGLVSKIIPRQGISVSACD